VRQRARPLARCSAPFPPAHRSDLLTPTLPLPQDESEKRFKEIGEAYEVLTDKQKRAVFDQFGEEGLKGVPAAGAGGPAGGGGSAPGGGGGGGGSGGGGMHFAHSHAGGAGGFNDPRVIFSQFFGTANPFAAFGGGM